MNYLIEKMPALRIFGEQITTTFKNNACMSDIPALWKRVHKEHVIQKIPHQLYDHVTIALYTDYTPDFSLTAGSFSYILGTFVTHDAKLTQRMVLKEIPASKYAIFTAQGPFATTIEATWKEIWKCQELDRTFSNDFEWYDTKSTDDEKSIVKIYVAIR